MRILLISYFFPPYNCIGAVRTGKTAKYLAKLGHDVRVLTAGDQPLESTLPLEIAADQVVATRWLNVNWPVELLLGGRRRVAAQGFAPPAGWRGVARRLGSVYRTLFNFPDGQIGWLPFALRAGTRLIAEWRPDLILASAMPPTALMAANRLSRRHSIPWIAELRDLWVDEGGYSHPAWRRRIEKRLEQRVLASASALVTVSQPLADHLAARYQCPTAVVLNGFDAEDLLADSAAPGGDLIRIVYTGMIYEGRRDPEPLLRALATLGSEAKNFRVEFYGRYLDRVQAMAGRHGVGSLVEVHPPVSHYAALGLQQQADLLLLLLDTNPQERGIYTGKLFEYLGARRPILALGPTSNVAADLIVDRKAGIVLQHADAIAEQLRRWLREKQTQGSIASLPADVAVGLTRQEQVAKLDVFLRQLLDATSRTGEAAPSNGETQSAPLARGRRPAFSDAGARKR